MAHLIGEMLRDGYLDIIRIRMMEAGHNNSSLAKATGYSAPHIGNILNGGGSAEALRVICAVLQIEIRDLLKDEFKELGLPNTDQNSRQLNSN